MQTGRDYLFVYGGRDREAELLGELVFYQIGVVQGALVIKDGMQVRMGGNGINLGMGMGMGMSMMSNGKDGREGGQLMNVVNNNSSMLMMSKNSKNICKNNTIINSSTKPDIYYTYNTQYNPTSPNPNHNPNITNTNPTNTSTSTNNRNILTPC